MYPEFIDDDVYLEMDSSKSEKAQMQAMLSNLTRIHLLTGNQFDSFDQLIQEYLVSGVEVFGMETGIVSRISEDGVYTVLDVVSPIDVLEKGMEFQLEDTYCCEVVKSGQVLGFPRVGALEYMCCHPVYLNLKLEAYLSAPIYVGDTLFGTFNFTSVTPRSNGFSRYEHNLIRLMAHSIGMFILLRNKEDKLIALNDKLKRFVGYVAHDLRNPLGTIIGYSKMIGKNGTSVERIRKIASRILGPAESALELVSTVLDNAALGTGHLTLDFKPHDVSKLMKAAIDSVELFCESKSIDIVSNFDFNHQIMCDEGRLSQTLVNLLINAIKYSPCGGEVSIDVKSSGEVCTISIQNHIGVDGENIAGLDQGLYGSVGFGLEIVDEVLTAHNTSKVMCADGGVFVVSFDLPVVAIEHE